MLFNEYSISIFESVSNAGPPGLIHNTCIVYMHNRLLNAATLGQHLLILGTKLFGRDFLSNMCQTLLKKTLFG